MDGTLTLAGRTMLRGKRPPLFVRSSLKLVVRGNNGYAYHSLNGHFAKESSRATYAYNYDIGLEPYGGRNLDASIVNAFYLLGKVHDVTYRYGFTEKAFNFQSSNFNRGGRENDGIVVSVHDRSKNNNAFFYALPECVPTAVLILYG
jgi:extracellular elastinolytic metalloproteinase